jgi:hypothetical protein
MKVFQIENSDESPSLIKRTVLGAIIFIIVASFFWQMMLGLCPVP